MNQNLNDIIKKISKVFKSHFGTTPLRQRNEDIYKEALELSRFTSIENLKEEHGDLLCSLLMSYYENGWDPEELIENTLSKIKRRKKQYLAYGRKNSIAIFGGAFDPITPGHVAVAEFVLNFSTIFDYVWIMPCFKHIYNKNMEDAKHRLEMCKLATKHDRRIIVSDYEIKNKLGGETYTLVKKLLNEDFAKHQFDFSIVIGMDNANTFEKWVNFEDLERLIRFIIIPRTGVEIIHKNNWYLKPPHMFLIPEIPLPETSSTYVRNELKSHPFYDRNMLNTDVYNYIIKNKLYGVK